jgi:hypothetical protein
MSKEFEKLSRSIADPSGFPLQLRIAQVANASTDWRVLVEEHPWSSDEPDSSGFIDLVLEEKNSSVQKMVIVRGSPATLITNGTSSIGQIYKRPRILTNQNSALFQVMNKGDVASWTEQLQN